MKKIFSCILIFLVTATLLRPQVAQAQMPVKARAFLTMAGYGAAGGALLGMATMAFGNSSRAIAQGASLGLYAGILFGTYVLVSHHQRRQGTYDDGSSPYGTSRDIYGDDYQADEGGGAGGPGRGGFFDRFEIMKEHLHPQKFTFDSEKRKGGQLPPLHLNLLQYNF
jgi:hypothetical protein